MDHLHKKSNWLATWMSIIFAVFIAGMLTEIYFPNMIRWIIVGMIVLAGLTKIALPWILTLIEGFIKKEE